MRIKMRNNISDVRYGEFLIACMKEVKNGKTVDVEGLGGRTRPHFSDSEKLVALHTSLRKDD